MQTITFYSYKGGTGRSLALANAARYLARLGFKVVALDCDLEAPGLHYKFSTSPGGKPLQIKTGVIDFLSSFIVDGQVSRPIKEFTLDVSVPGIDKPLILLIPAGNVPSAEYWSKLSRINWHDLFYSTEAKGVQVFLELKNRILDELGPDFLLVDSRTGITEMGGVATTLLADKVICLVLQTLEDLEGTRAVLRSLKRFRRESGEKDLEVIVALSRLPEVIGSGDERKLTDQIRSVLNEEAEDLKDTLSCVDIFVLHSEAALQVRESLRVGGSVSPDDSILLRDYLRLFASVVPWESIEPKVHDLVQQAKEKVWVDADAAVKEVEELAASFGHPEIYRELLRFYEVRNVGGIRTLKRAQGLWELSGKSDDPTLWKAVIRGFETLTIRYRRSQEWSPNLDFIRAVWQDAGRRDPAFALKIAESYHWDDRESLAADVLLEVIRSSEPNGEIVSRCIAYLDVAKRAKEADALIQQFKAELGNNAEFVAAWARHALRDESKDSVSALIQAPMIQKLNPTLAIQVYSRAGLLDEAAAIAPLALEEVAKRRLSTGMLFELGEVFQAMGAWEDFEDVVDQSYPDEVLAELRERLGIRRRRK